MIVEEIKIPENVMVEISNKRVKVTGEKGTLERTFKYFFDIEIKKENNKISVVSESDRKKVKATVGSIAAHIKNMIKGVTKGFRYKLKIVYSHFPMNVKVEDGNVIIKNFLGERTPRIAKIVGDTKVEVKGQDIEVSGIDVESVGQTCANMENACRIVGRDRRVFQDGIWIVSKE